MVQETIRIDGLFESFSEAEQEQIRKAALVEGVAVEVLMRRGLMEIASRINASVFPPDPDPTAQDGHREAA